MPRRRDVSAAIAPLGNLTDCGLPGIRDLPYGVHMCQMYRGRSELAAAVVPFFAAGLRRNERCIWVTSAPLDTADARAELAGLGIDVGAAERSGQLSVVSYDEWYLDKGHLSAHAICASWLAEEERALAAGYAGLRVSGNVSFLKQEDWASFMDYEQIVDAAFRGRRIVALCCYSRESCGPSEVLDVMKRHSCALDRPDEGWQVLTRQAVV